MTIAALRALLDQELPHIQRPPAPRLTLPRWTAKESPPVPESPPTPPPAGGSVSDALDWAADHHDPDIRALGDNIRASLADLYARRAREAELAHITAELAEVDARAAQLRARQAELQPPPTKHRGRVDYPAAEVRAWARQTGLDCPATGRVPTAIVQAWRDRDVDG